MTKLAWRHIDLDPASADALTAARVPVNAGGPTTIADALLALGAPSATPARVYVVSTDEHVLATENMLEDVGIVLATEGKEVLAATITPVVALSTVRVEAEFFVGTNSTSAVAAIVVNGVPTLVRRVCIQNNVASVRMAVEVPSTGAAMHVALRVGRGADTGTVYVNRVGAAQMFAAENNITSLTLTEHP